MDDQKEVKNLQVPDIPKYGSYYCHDDRSRPFGPVKRAIMEKQWVHDLYDPAEQSEHFKRDKIRKDKEKTKFKSRSSRRRQDENMKPINSPYIGLRVDFPPPLDDEIKCEKETDEPPLKKFKVDKGVLNNANA